MPVQRCTRDGQQGWQYGDTGKCYLASEEGGDDNAKQKAYLQGAAIEGGGPLDETQHMAELDVPTIKQGIFNGFELSNLEQVAADTLKAMPYLREAQQTGAYRGANNARFNTEPIPPFLHLRHFPNDIAFEKVKEWAKDVEMIPDTRLMNGEQWGFTHFTNVDPELAKLLSVGFPYRSAEFLPDFENPDTGEIYPVVLRSVAFLDANTEPAVPQYPGYSVKLASSGSGVLTVPCQEPESTNQQKETTVMEKDTSTVKLSQEDIQRFEALETRLRALETENVTLKGVVNEVKQEKDLLTSQVTKFQQDAKTAQVDAFCLKLEKDYNLTPAAIQAIRPVVSAENGIVKMSADSEGIPADQAYMQSLEAVLKLARDKDALFVPQSGVMPTGKQPEKRLSAVEQREAAILKLQKDAEAQGKELSYADARLQVVAADNSILDRIAKMSAGEGGE